MAGEGMTEGTLDVAKGADRRVLTRLRWEPVLGGLLVLAMGAIIAGYPDITLADIVLLMGTVLLVEGIFLAIGSFALKAEDPLWALLLLGGAVSVVVSVIILGWPDLGADMVLWLFGAWALLVGAAEMGWALKVRGDTVVAGRFSYASFGLFGIIFGLVALTWPDATVLTIPISIGIFAMWFGLLLIIAGYQRAKG